MQKALVAELLGTLLFQFFVGFSKGDALAAGISFGVLRMFPASTYSIPTFSEASLEANRCWSFLHAHVPLISLDTSDLNSPVCVQCMAPSRSLEAT